MMKEKLSIEDLASVVHAANKAYCEALGDFSQVDFSAAAEWQKESAINGVLHCIENPEATPEDSHDNWLKEKIAHGWQWGPSKDANKLEHPCILPYDALPKSQRVKDVIFTNIVHAFLRNDLIE